MRGWRIRPMTGSITSLRCAGVGAGVFHGAVEAQPGQWELIVDLYRGDERVFRSRSRVTLR